MKRVTMKCSACGADMRESYDGEHLICSKCPYGLPKRFQIPKNEDDELDQYKKKGPGLKCLIG